jgi:hypothetical protein
MGDARANEALLQAMANDKGRRADECGPVAEADRTCKWMAGMRRQGRAKSSFGVSPLWRAMAVNAEVKQTE